MTYEQKYKLKLKSYELACSVLVGNMARGFPRNNEETVVSMANKIYEELEEEYRKAFG